MCMVEGPKGKLGLDLPPRTAVKLRIGKVLVSREGEDARSQGACMA